MTLPAGWIENTHAGETLVAPYTGDQTHTWTGGPTGAQPHSAANPSGTVGSVAVMALTAEVVKLIFGPQDS
jgi:hypothetical protein